MRPRSPYLYIALIITFGGLTGCTNDPNGGEGGEGGSGTGGISGGAGGDGGTGGATTPEYGSCLTEVPGTCATGLECVSFGMLAFCIKACSPPYGGGCPGDQICLPQYDDFTAGFCAERREHFETCVAADQLSGCDRDAFCLTQSTSMSDRCVPVCDVGDLGNYNAVAACPDLPIELGGGPTDCLPISIGAASGSLCGIEVNEGEPCDQALWRCNLEDSRPDTDDATEPTLPTDPDPGALSCLPVADGARCLRLCTGDDFVSESPCTCPVADTLCADPVDPGVGWSCVGWSELSTGLGGCMKIEDCSGDSALCLDNGTSDWTSCDPTPYDTGPSSICGP